MFKLFSSRVSRVPWQAIVVPYVGKAETFSFTLQDIVSIQGFKMPGCTVECLSSAVGIFFFLVASSFYFCNKVRLLD